MFNPGDIISYLDMCSEEGVNLQRGMNFRLRGRTSVILMSLRRGAPYVNRVEEGGRVLIYEGHDIARAQAGPDPRSLDQPMRNPNGGLTQNGLFFEAAHQYRNGEPEPEHVKVYEKIFSGIWSYNGLFKLVDAWKEENGKRKVFKFRLEFEKQVETRKDEENDDIEQSRLIPTAVKLEVWKRDKGHCIQCGSQDNLHFIQNSFRLLVRGQILRFARD